MHKHVSESEMTSLIKVLIPQQRQDGVIKTDPRAVRTYMRQSQKSMMELIPEQLGDVYENREMVIRMILEQ